MVRIRPESGGSPAATVFTWLNHVGALFPPRHLVVVGAGGGEGELMQYLRRSAAPSALLVEAEEGPICRLQQAAALHPGWVARQHVVNHRDGPATFYVASVSCESGLLEPEELRAFWPNIRTVRRDSRDAIALPHLIREGGTPANWLAIDCLSAGHILHGASDQLDAIEVLLVRCVLHSDEQASLVVRLTAIGFISVAATPGRHPSIGHVLFVRDPKRAVHLQARIHHLENQLAQMRKEEIQWTAERREYLERLKQFEATQASHAQLASLAISEKLTRFAETLLRKLDERATELIEKTGKPDPYVRETLQRLGAELIEARSDIQLLDRHLQVKDTETPTTATSEELNKVAKKMISELDARTRVIVEELDARFALLEQLTLKRPYVRFTGWAVSASSSVILMEMLRRNEYDAVIEFGSGQSTALMCQSILSLNPTSMKSPEIISFEHDKHYLAATRNLLREHGCEADVRLVHAPLVQTVIDGRTYLYYDCAEEILRLGHRLQKTSAKLFVIVDGPPSETNKHARFPALPILSACMLTHEIHIFVDDFRRADEQQMLEMWKAHLEARSVRYRTEIIKSGKGVCVLFLNSPDQPSI